jgi:3-phosphoglycerate kinase
MIVSKEITKPEINRLETTQTTFSKIEFNKNNIFFRSIPNEIAYDRVRIKNTGTTCIYFKWQKSVKPFNLGDKKSEGMDRFFCHYSDSKLFPDEEKEFIFSFFSEKNGVFYEDWALVTEPPLKNTNLTIHLNGMCLLIEDRYTETIKTLDLTLYEKSIKTMVEELVVDLITSIKADEPPLPDMSDPKIFKYFFLKYNKEYTVEFSNFTMQQFNHFISEVLDFIKVQNHVENMGVASAFSNDEMMGGENIPMEGSAIDMMQSSQALNKEEEPISYYWNGSIDVLKHKINTELNNTEIKSYLHFKLNNLIHMSLRKQPEDSLYYQLFRNQLIDLAMEIPEINNQIREELILPPFVFDYFTRQSLTTDKEINAYNNEQNKRKDEFYKKTKKKPPKNAEEEEKEINEFRIKFFDAVKDRLAEKSSMIAGINKIRAEIAENVLNAQLVDEECIDRLNRVKTIKTVKNEGLEGKTVVLRIDIEPQYYEPKYENSYDEEGNFKGKFLKEIDFPQAKEILLNTMSFLLDNRVKTLILLADFGPKTGYYLSDYSMKHFYDFLNKNNLVEQQINFIPNYLELLDFNRKIENEEYKDNSLLILENLNFLPEECLFETDSILENGVNRNLKYFTKMKLTEILSQKDIFINDSPIGIMKSQVPSVMNMQCTVKAIGQRLEAQLSKLTFFFQINSPNFLLIMGDNYAFNCSNPGSKLNCDFDQEIYNSLLTLNAIMQRFRVIFLLGKLALAFIQFLQKDFIFDLKYDANPVFHNLMKYILIKAHLYNIEIVFPDDVRVLHKGEFNKFVLAAQLSLLNNNVGVSKDGNLNFLKSSTKMVNKIKSQSSMMINLNQSPNTENMEGIEQIEQPPITDYVKNIKNLFRKEAEMEKVNLDDEDLENDPNYNKNKLEEFEKELLTYYKTEPLEFKSNYVKQFVEAQNINKPQKIFKNDLEIRNYHDYMYFKPVISLEPTSHINDKTEVMMGSLKSGSVNKSQLSQNIQPSPATFTTLIDEDYEIIDYGNKTYEKLNNYINSMNCVMWLGKLSPSIVENLFDNYSKLTRTMYDRKKYLLERFNEAQEEEEKNKRLHDSDLKAKKDLFNLFIKSKEVYEIIKLNLRKIHSLLQGNAPGVS